MGRARAQLGLVQSGASWKASQQEVGEAGQCRWGFGELLPRAMAESLLEPSGVRKLAKNFREGQQAAILRIQESCFPQVAEIQPGRKDPGLCYEVSV